METEPSGRQESWREKALREVNLIGQGVVGFRDAAEESFDTTEHAFETVGKVALAGAAGIVLAKFAPARGILGALARTGGTAMGLSFAGDLLFNGGQVARAFGDTWRSNDYGK